MIDYKYGDLFLKHSIDKQIVITDDAGTVRITNKELYSQKFEITETLCSEEQLVFGSCEASVLKFTAANVFVSLKGKWINANMTLDGNTDTPFCIGRYKVQSDKPTADRKKREYIAYDALYDIINAEVSEWYNTILQNKDSTTTLKAFRDSFFSHFGIEQEEVTLINDDMVIEKSIEPSELSGKTVINAICEINGCFGHIGRDGKFKYIYLEPIQEGLYPSETLYPSENLYPSDPNTSRLSNKQYISASYEDYFVEKITKLQIRQEEDDIGAVIGSGDNAYVVQDNFLVYGKSADEMQTIGQKIFDKISGIYYRPFNAKVKGNPCFEVGDAISLQTKYTIIHSYILQRTLTGIQALRDEYVAEGSQHQPTQVNSVNRSIQQLQGRYNKLTRAIDETRSEIGNLETRTETRFIQTDEKIIAEAKRASEAEASLSVRADQIVASVNAVSSDLKNNYYTITETDTKIDASEAGILLSVSKNYYTITEADTAISSLQSQIDINAGKISLAVSAGEVQSMIDVSLDEIVITADKIKLEGYFSANNGFSINEFGDAILSAGNTTMTVTQNGIIISHSSGMTIYGTSVIALNSKQVIVSDVYGITIGTSEAELLCNKLNGYTPITSDNISSYVEDYSGDITTLYNAINDLDTEIKNAASDAQAALDGVSDNGTEIIYIKQRLEALETLLSGGSWTYLQLEGYDGDEYAYSYFTK